ncbi:hypothetical protein T4C_5789 [Trichinella pseudospiralis]|uniref:Uncharacterized protein n=1 Tax=Trichinella pseudospiralis TaxID=6337 RepID=A0A0V1J014_TRIPS|nr:hypothetical protein T4C_5789 [Trichinella pseudospiralis]
MSNRDGKRDPTPGNVCYVAKKRLKDRLKGVDVGSVSFCLCSITDNGLKVMENPLSKTGKYYRTLHNLIGSVVETSELFRLLKTAHFL